MTGKAQHRPITENFLHCQELIRKVDPDRYLLAILDSGEKRHALFAIAAFNAEIARIRESVSEPLLGHIRLQWWRDVMDGLYDGQPHEHLVAADLYEVIGQFELSKSHFECLIDARQRDLEKNSLATIDELVEFAGETAAPLFWLSSELSAPLREEDKVAGWHLGVAWAICGLIRALPFHLREGMSRLPDELLENFNVDSRRLAANSQPAETRSLTRYLDELVETNLEKFLVSSGSAGKSRYAGKTAVDLVQVYRGRLRRFGYDPFDPRLALQPPLITWRLLLGDRFRRLMG